MTTDDGAQYLTTDEVAELLGMSERTVRKYARALGGTRRLNARSWRFDRAQLATHARRAGFNVPPELEQEGQSHV